MNTACTQSIILSFLFSSNGYSILFLNTLYIYINGECVCWGGEGWGLFSVDDFGMYNWKFGSSGLEYVCVECFIENLDQGINYLEVGIRKSG